MYLILFNVADEPHRAPEWSPVGSSLICRKSPVFTTGEGFRRVTDENIAVHGMFEPADHHRYSSSCILSPRMNSIAARAVWPPMSNPTSLSST